MAEMRLKAESDQPPGWIVRREEVREIDGGLWRRISIDFSQREYDRVRLETLAQLEIDFLNRDELHDYLAWLANSADVEISDMYRFYLGYHVGEMTMEQ